MRKAHAAFRMPLEEMLQTNLRFIDIDIPNVIAYVLKDHVNGEKWKDILVILNGNRYSVSVEIPEGNWTVVCHDGQINLSGITQTKSTFFTVAPSSASILYVE